MNERLNRERLLRDVLAEEPDADFRAALLDQSLRLAGRRRRGRRARRATAAAGVVFGLAVLVWRFGQPPSRGPEPRGYATVRTQPMVAGRPRLDVASDPPTVDDRDRRTLERRTTGRVTRALDLVTRVAKDLLYGRGESGKGAQRPVAERAY